MDTHALTDTKSRYRQGLMLLLALLVATAMLAGGPAQASPDTPEAHTQEGPCLQDDPYNLQGLYQYFEDETPERGMQRFNPYLTAEWVGKGNLMDEAPLMPEERIDDEASTDPEPPKEEALYRQMEFSVFNAATKNQFHLVMQQTMLDTINECHEKTGRTSATEGVDREEVAERGPTIFTPLVLHRTTITDTVLSAAATGPAGWSNGIDTRVVLSPTTLWPWRTISQFRYGSTDESRCTGTLIGPRHLITAAHCINEQGTNNWYTIRVAPGKNGVGVEPYGSSVIKINPDPGTSAWYFTPWQWRNPATTHRQWDWGLIVIPDRLGDQTGWMGYVAVPGSYLKMVNNYNRGYPLCDTDRNNEPAGCQDSRLYGDLNHCGIGNFYNKGPDNWNRRITISCDLSAGHSGSAIYNYFWDSNLGKYVPVVAMMAVTESCTTCGPLSTYPNAARRITPGDLGTISWLRETFP